MNYRQLAWNAVNDWVEWMGTETRWDMVNGRVPYGGWPFENRTATIEDWLAYAVMLPAVMHDNCDANDIISRALDEFGMSTFLEQEPHWNEVWKQIPFAAAEILAVRMKEKES
jgi:hypothetical protein